LNIPLNSLDTISFFLYYNNVINRTARKGLFFICIINMKLVDYIKSSIEEMKKVTWPTKKEVYSYTSLVIAISLGLAIFLGALDYVFSSLFSVIIK